MRSVLELAVPAWNAALSQVEKKDIERIQKTALHIILGDSYHSYVNALDIVGLESLEARRHKLCLKFARKAAAHPKHRNWFKLNMNTVNTRQENKLYCHVYSNHNRFDKSPLAYLTNLLNTDNKK